MAICKVIWEPVDKDTHNEGTHFPLPLHEMQDHRIINLYSGRNLSNYLFNSFKFYMKTSKPREIKSTSRLYNEALESSSPICRTRALSTSASSYKSDRGVNGNWQGAWLSPLGLWCRNNRGCFKHTCQFTLVIMPGKESF